MFNKKKRMNIHSKTILKIIVNKINAIKLRYDTALVICLQKLPLKYPLIMTTRRTSKLLTCIWLAALVIQLPLIYISMNPNKTCIKYHCSRLVLWLHIIQQLAAICVMTTLNYKMFKIVKEQRQRMASLRICVTASTVRVGTNHDLVTSSCKGSESYEDIRHYRWSLDMLFCSIYCLGSSIWYFK